MALYEMACSEGGLKCRWPSGPPRGTPKLPPPLAPLRYDLGRSAAAKSSLKANRLRCGKM